MTRLVIALFLLAAVSGCSYHQSEEAAEAKILNAKSVRPGYGVIDSVTVQRGGDSASAGGTRPAHRLVVRMDSSALQIVDVDNPTFMPEERVELTADGRVVRVSGTTLKLGR
jgi:hypothetical protein